MADQGLPLMALPQQNLFGAAGDDLAGQLANREIAKRKQMLEDIKTQIEMQKSQNETNLANSTVQTASSQRRINEAKAPLDLDKIGGEVTQMADQHAKSLSDQQTQQSLRQAMDEFDTAQKSGDAEGMTRAGGKIVGYGGHLMTKDQADAINAPVYQQQLQGLLKAYAEEKDPDKKQAIGMQMANIPGAKGVPTADSTPFQSFGNGGIMDSRTGKPVREPQPPAGAGALTGDQGTNTIQGYKDLLRHGAQISAIPAAARNAVVADMAQKGETFETLTMQGRAMTDLSKTLVPKIDNLKQTWAQIQAADLTGTIRGRLRQLAAGESLAAAAAGLSEAQKNLLGKFEGEVSLFTSGTTRAHFQRAGSETYAIMEKLLNPAGKDYETYLGNLDAANEYLSSYANMGGLHGPGETLLTPPVGAGKGGGSGAAPAAVDPSNPLGLPRIR